MNRFAFWRGEYIRGGEIGSATAAVKKASVREAHFWIRAARARRLGLRGKKRAETRATPR